MATLDVLGGLAELAVSRNYCRPELVAEPVLELEDGRHPVLDQTLPPGTIVPNDAQLGPEVGQLWLVTGPNMAGKSIFIKQIALLTLLAQAGSFVPAEGSRSKRGAPCARSMTSGPCSSRPAASRSNSSRGAPRRRSL